MTATLEAGARLTRAKSDGELPKPFRIKSYSHLLRFPEITDAGPGATGRSVDAIIVPTIRSPEQLRSAVRLAADAGCRLIALYTDAFPADLSSVLDEMRPGMATALAVGSGIGHRLLDLAASLPQTAVSSCALDISRKRNLGLLIGRACGWTRMLFLDDDIRKVSREKLRSAAELLDEYPVVGLQVTKYPDASVIGHAFRRTGHGQKPFISGGSLLVDPQRFNGFFPAVYHEDWLSLINHLKHGEVAIGGTVGQLPYKPFTTPERARFEEFGDTLAAGLLELVDANPGTASSAAAERDYWCEATKIHFWQEILKRRGVLLNNVAERLKIMLPLDLRPLESVRAAQQRHNELEPEEFAAFTAKWVDGLAVWRTWLSHLPHADSVTKALADLGVLHAVHIYEARPQQAAARGIRWTGGFAGRWGRRAAADGRPRFCFRSSAWAGASDLALARHPVQSVPGRGGDCDAEPPRRTLRLCSELRSKIVRQFWSPERPKLTNDRPRRAVGPF